MSFSGYPAGNTTSGVKKLLEKSGYSEKAIGYYLRKVNVGSIENPSAQEAYTGPCGDTLEVYLKIESNVIKDAKFQAIGCAGAFASGSALMEIIKGKALDEAEKITEEDLIDYLGGIPKQKFHCTCLAKRALQMALEKYKKSRT
jgi:NifU-like protein involved in Fe-S cluster formation